MIADFYKTFGKSSDKKNDVPQEVLDLFFEDLPSNFMYYKKKDGNYCVGPRQDLINEKTILKLDLDPQFVEDNLKNIQEDKWPEYIYRMQLKVPVNNSKIGNCDKLIPLEQTLGNPLLEDVKIDKAFLYPEPFPPAKKLIFETIEGDKITLSIVRKPYPSLDEIYFTNINFFGFSIRVYLSDDQTSSKITYSIMPKKAETVSDAIAALHLFKGLYQGTVKINGERISKPIIGDDYIDDEKFKSMLDFWETARNLEKALDVSFVPSTEFSMEDAEIFSQLAKSILHGNKIIWRHPFDHFHTEGNSINDGNFDDFIGKENVEYSFVEGPIQFTLLGAKFNLYSKTKLFNMVITNVEWDDNKTSGDVYISDSVDGQWKLSRRYMTKKQMDIEIKNNS